MNPIKETAAFRIHGFCLGLLLAFTLGFLLYLRWMQSDFDKVRFVIHKEAFERAQGF